MKCQKCGKYDATTHITEIINGLKSEAYLCPNCAEISGSQINMNSIFNSNLDNFFSSFWASSNPLNAPPKKQCPVCKSTLSDIQKNGRLGCSECYTEFHDFLLRPLKEIHGSTEHIGKIPSRAGKDIRRASKVSSLKDELSRAVLDQNFEKAAELRDRIKEIESQDKEV